MKLAVFASLLRELPALSFPEALRWAKAQKIEAVEADSGEFTALPPSEYRAVLDGAGMKMLAVHHSCRLSLPDGEMYEAEIKGCESAAASAAECGAKYLMLIPANPGDIPDIQAKASAAVRVAESLGRAADIAEKAGLTLTVENFSKTLLPFSTADELLYLAKAEPRLQLTLDSGNFRCVGEDMPGAYEKIKGKLAFCHIKDWRVSDGAGYKIYDGTYLGGCPLGCGIVPTGELMFRLKTDGYNGWLVIEQESAGRANPMEYCISQAAKYLGALK